jgi:glyoxylase I family protein
MEKAMPNTGHNTAIDGGGFHHLAIRSYDYDKSFAFYTEALGFRRVHGWGLDERATGGKDGRVSLLDTGDGNYIELFAGSTRLPDAETPEAPVWHVAFRTNNCAAALERARAAGATVTVETKTVTPDHSDRPIALTIAFFKGPDGEIIELFQNEEL